MCGTYHGLVDHGLVELVDLEGDREQVALVDLEVHIRLHVLLVDPHLLVLHLDQLVTLLVERSYPLNLAVQETHLLTDTPDLLLRMLRFLSVLVSTLLKLCLSLFYSLFGLFDLISLQLFKV
jgi:hypothetical protein